MTKQLSLVEKNSPVEKNLSKKPLHQSLALHPGIAVKLIEGHSVLADFQGICAAFTMDRLASNYPSIDQQTHEILVWDGGLSSVDLPKELTVQIANEELRASSLAVKDNEFHLVNATLAGPNLIQKDEECHLQLIPRFEISYSTHHFAGQLGEIRLVESQRFVTTEQGEKYSIVDTNEQSVLVPSEAESITSVNSEAANTEIFSKIFAAQAIHREENFTTEVAVQQAIPDLWENQAVASVTVLERFTSFFMQRAIIDGTPISDTQDHPIRTHWVPVLAPVQWGWSIRVAPIAHGDWGIVRRKLMLPTVGHEGLQLPEWQGSLTDCYQEQQT